MLVELPEPITSTLLHNIIITNARAGRFAFLHQNFTKRGTIHLAPILVRNLLLMLLELLGSTPVHLSIKPIL